MTLITAMLLAVLPLQAKANILGSTAAGTGDLIVLDASGSVGESFHWVTIPETPNKYVLADGKKLILSGKAGDSYIIVLAVADKGSVDQCQHTVMIGGDPDSIPTPGPRPKPPEPVLPNLTGFAKQVHDWVLRHVNQSDRAKALALSRSYSSVASAIAAGALKLPSDIVQTVRDQNRVVYTPEPGSWVEWDRRVAAEMEDMSEKGTLKTADDFRKLYVEIAKGLEASK